MKQMILAVGLLAALVSLTASAQMIVTDDTFSSSASPRTNFGHAIAIVVQSPTAGGLLLSPQAPSKSASHGFIRFDLSLLPAGLTGTDVSNGTLRLFVNSVIQPGSFDIYLAGASWTEDSLNDNNAPPLGKQEVKPPGLLRLKPGIVASNSSESHETSPAQRTETVSRNQ